MPNRYILALIKSETFNDDPQIAHDFAQRERRAQDEPRNQPAQPGVEAKQLTFAFAR
jgi:hypothetical protein